ncbi:MAG: nitroreductase family protein, partial [Akkermansiaceae bacterium]
MEETQELSFQRQDEVSMQTAAESFYQSIKKRRTVREFSPDPIPDGVIENCLLSAGTAPNGANLQPWHFAVVKSAEVKQKIRVAAEEEEKEFYGGRATEEWLDVLAHLGTDDQKP